MIQINPLQSYIDGGARAAITTPPSASLVFDLPGKAIWVKGVKLKGTDHAYTFSHDNYISITNTPDQNNPESEDIKIGINTTLLKLAIDTTYGIVNATTNGLAPMFSNANKASATAATTYNFLGIAGSTLKWYQLPWRNVRINAETSDVLGIDNTDPLIISSGNGIEVSWDSTNKKIVITNTKPDINHNTDTHVSQLAASDNADRPVILKQSANTDNEVGSVRYTSTLLYNPSTKVLKINGNRVVTFADTYVGATSSANATTGLVPVASSANRNKFLRGDGTWLTPSDYNTWRPIKVGTTDVLGSGTDTGALVLAAGIGITLGWDSTNKQVIITNSSPDVNHNTDRTGVKLGTVSGTKKTDGTVIITNSSAGLTFQGGTNLIKIGDGTNYIEVPITIAHGLSTKNMKINGTDYAIYTSASSLPTFIAPGSFGSNGQLLGTNGSAFTWITPSWAASNHTHNYLSIVRSINGSTHAEALLNEFTNNKSSIPRNALINYYSSAYSNGSQYFGYFLSGYDSNPYGGFYVAHYNTPYYVGISNGTFTLWELSRVGHKHAYTDLTGSGTTANLAILSNGTANGWKLATVSLSNHTHPLSIAVDSGTSSIALAASTKYKLTAGGSTYIFTSTPDENVKQSNNDNNQNSPILLKNGTGTGNITSGTIFADGVTVNPSTNSLTVAGNIIAAKFHSNASATDRDLTRIPSDAEIALETGNGNGAVSAWIWRENYAPSNWGIFHNNSTDEIDFVGNNNIIVSIGLGGGSGQYLRYKGTQVSLEGHTHAWSDISGIITNAKLPARLKAYGQDTSDHRNADTTCLENGFYWVNAGTLPPNVGDADIITVNANTSYGHQLAFKFSGGGTTGSSYDGKDLYTRIYSGGSWLPWYTILTSGNWSSIINPSTLSVYTKTESDDRFVNVTGDTMSGTLTITYYGPTVHNYVNKAWAFQRYTAYDSDGTYTTNMYDIGTYYTRDTFEIRRNGNNNWAFSPNYFYGYANNAYYLGTTSYRWANIYTYLVDGYKFHSNASSSTDITHIPSDTEVALETGDGGGGVSAWIWREKYAPSNWGMFHDNNTNDVIFVGSSVERVRIALDHTSLKVGGTEVSLNGHTHDDRYYTETESNGRFVLKSGDTMTGALQIQMNPATLYLTTNVNDNYSIIRFGTAANTNAAYIFHNGSSRTDDGGANMMTIRNNVGDLRLHNRTKIEGHLDIFPNTGGNYGDGIRLHSRDNSNGWCAITYCASDNTGLGASGMTANSWYTGVTGGNFYIGKGGTGSGSEHHLRSVNQAWDCTGHWTQSGTITSTYYGPAFHAYIGNGGFSYTRYTSYNSSKSYMWDIGTYAGEEYAFHIRQNGLSNWRFNATEFWGHADNTYYLGRSSNRWANIFSYKGNFISTVYILSTNYGSYNEGIRIYQTPNDWAGILFARRGEITYGNDGTSTNSWFLATCGDNMYINKGTSSPATASRLMGHANGWTIGNTNETGYTLSVGGKSIIRGGGLHIWPDGAGGYNDGIRIHPRSSDNAWCAITFCGTDNTGDSGISAKSWFVGNYSGNFYINRNYSSEQNASRIWGHTNGYTIGNTSTSSYALNVGGNIYATSTIISAGLPAFLTAAGTGSWNYVRIHNGSYLWDIASNTNSIADGLEIRPSGGTSQCTFYIDGHVTFRTNVYAANFSTTSGGFYKSGSSDSYVLLGGGGHKAVSDFAAASHEHGPLLYINGSSSNLPRICWHIPNVNWGNISLNTNGEFYFRTGNSASNGFAGVNMGSLWVNGNLYIDAGSRIDPEGGALYIGNANNASWVGIQDCCSQASLGDSYWSLRTNGTAHFVAAYHNSDIRQKRDLQFVTSKIVDEYFNTEYGYLTEFTWKRDGKRSFGTIAQWIENFCPESIDKKSNGYFSVNYNAFLSKVCACNFVKIKEIISSNQDLYTKIQKLEKEVSELRLELKKIKKD